MQIIIPLRATFQRDFLLQEKIMKGGEIMLGIPDAGIWLAYILCIASAILCVVYGIVNWNKGDEANDSTS